MDIFGITLSPSLNKNGEIKVVIIVMTPINGNRKLLTAPTSTPTFTITIENSPLGAESAKAERSDFLAGCLNMKFPSIFPPNFIPMETAIRAIAIRM